LVEYPWFGSDVDVQTGYLEYTSFPLGRYIRL
jgi:hypothetical protein